MSENKKDPLVLYSTNQKFKTHFKDVMTMGKIKNL